MKRLLLAAFCAALGPGAAAAQQPTRLILINGDGVGLAQWSVARLSAEAPLAIARLPVIGLMDTRCLCERTTDSGAAATAFATGHRTRYRFVGVGPDSTPQTSVLEVAEARGLSTGMVTTVHITDATPAAFGADAATRYDRQGIAAQYAARDIEVLLGGGRYFFQHRTDGRDLLRELRSRYTIVTTPAQFESVDLAHTTHLLGLFTDSTIYPRTGLRPTLPAMASAALAILDRNPRGFFLLLENEDTDDVLHERDSLPKVYRALKELDQTVAVALAYQQKHPETLIVVLGDHETGGLTLQLGAGQALSPSYSTGDHTAVSTPLFAGGPGAGRFGRWLGNDEVGRLLLEFVGQR